MTDSRDELRAQNLEDAKRTVLDAPPAPWMPAIPCHDWPARDELPAEDPE